MSGSSTTAVTPGIQIMAQASVANGSATKLVAATPAAPAKQSVNVQAPRTNTVSVWVGLSDVTDTKGVEIAPGATIPFECQDPSTLYTYATSVGQKVNAWWS